MRSAALSRAPKLSGGACLLDRTTQDRRRSGDTVTFGYDALNRATSASFSANAAQNYTQSWDLLDRPLIRAYTASGATSLTNAWDALSRLASETIAGGGEPTGGRKVSYGYDAAGDRTGITWPDTGSNALTATYVFDVLQRVTSIKVGTATIAAYGYDSLGRRSSIARNGGSGAGTTYGYDGADRINSLVQSLSGTSAVTWTLGYDPASGLASRQVSNGTYSFHPGTANVPYVANGLDQYTSISGQALAYSDGRANLTSLSPSGPTFTYDTANDLLTASGPTAVTLAYDPTGRIQTKTAGGATSTFLYSGQMLIGEYDSAGNILARYIPGPATDEAAPWYSGSGTTTPQWLHADAQGSTIAWSNATGASLGTQAYDPWGLPQVWSGSRYAFTGQLMIGEAQLYHYKARAYDPAIGRFLQTDPAGYASDLNPYAYVFNDPLSFIDPSRMATPNPDWYCPPFGGDPVSCWGEPGVGGGPAATGGSGAFGGGGAGDSGGNADGGKGAGKLIPPIIKALCRLVPSGRVVGVSGSIGGISSTVAGGQIVQNYKSGQISVFGSGGFQGGWNGGLNVSIFGGFIWGPLANSNSNFAGRFVGGNVGSGLLGGAISTGNRIVVIAPAVGAALTPSITGSVTFATRPVQLGKAPPVTALDQMIALLKQVCS